MKYYFLLIAILFSLVACRSTKTVEHTEAKQKVIEDSVINDTEEKNVEDNITVSWFLPNDSISFDYLSNLLLLPLDSIGNQKPNLPKWGFVSIKKTSKSNAKIDKKTTITTKKTSKGKNVETHKKYIPAWKKTVILTVFVIFFCLCVARSKKSENKFGS